MDVTLGNAPVSYGVFELTVGTDHVMPVAERLFDEIAVGRLCGRGPWTARVLWAWGPNSQSGWPTVD